MAISVGILMLVITVCIVVASMLYVYLKDSHGYY
jgi:hypothetical protein